MFQVWTEPKHLMQWWGPKGFKMKHAKMDLCPGGMYLYGMGAPDGTDMWGKFIFREIVKPEKLVFLTSFSDEKGGTTRHPMSPDWPLVLLSEICFKTLGTKTEVLVAWQAVDASEVEVNTFNSGFASMKQGWGGTLDQLDAYLATQTSDGKVGTEVNFTRILDAKPELVYKMWTEPKHFAAWFGPHGFTCPRCELELEVGGKIAIDMKSSQGELFPNRGIFKELNPPNSLTFEFNVQNEREKTVMTTRTSVTIEEYEGKTRMKVTSLVIHMLPEAAPYVEGMNEGWKQTLDRFEEHVAKA